MKELTYQRIKIANKTLHQISHTIKDIPQFHSVIKQAIIINKIVMDKLQRKIENETNK